MKVKFFGVFVFGVYVYLYRVQPGHFLALLDYVSRAHGMGSAARHPSSVVRPSVASIISEATCIAWIPFKFW